MKRRDCLLLALAVLLAAPAMATSHEEEAAQPLIYGTYSQCDLNDQWLADMLVEQVFAPAYNAAVEAGEIMGWGYLAHHTGGKWRRVIYHVAADTGALLDALTSINDKIADEHPEASAKYSEICGAHDDYIWRYEAGSAGMEETLAARAKVGMSAYFVCDPTREERADEIVKEVFAPVYNAHVGEGGLSSWAWFGHRVGGKYRRLLATSAADDKTALSVRGKIIQKMIAEHGEAFAELNDICGSHQDYLWGIVVDNP